MNILCISTYFKGIDFLKSCFAEGNNVYLITNRKLEHKPWPKENINEIIYLDNIDNISATYDQLISLLAERLKSIKMDIVVALDDFDVEKAAHIRENFRIPGMGQTTARNFRDKLAMRMSAKSAGISIPDFSSLFYDIDITEFLQNTQEPWLIKPRSEASATGIRKVYTFDEAWQNIHQLGDKRHEYLIECFKPGDVYHVDSIVCNNKIIFTQCSRYMNTPFEVAHGGGIFRSITVEYNSADYEGLNKINKEILEAFKLKNGVAHTEIIKNHETGEFYFLETASRVGGAHLAEMVEAASGINLWKEWAKIEISAFLNEKYILPKRKNLYSGITISLSSQQWPNMAIFNDDEIVWKMQEEYHVGLIVASKSQKKIGELLDKYAYMIKNEGLHASAPAPDKPTH